MPDPAAALPRASISFPTRYRFGWGRRGELAHELAVAGITRALVVTDATVAALPWFAPLIETVTGAGGSTGAGNCIAGIVTAISTNPTEAEALAALARYRELGATGVCAIGGGAAMDAGKVVALLAAAAPTAADAVPGVVATLAVGGARARSLPAAAPIVAVPTTSGTGSELSTGAVITDAAAGAKRTLLHPSLMPRAVLADAETTVGLPPGATAATGMDALTHAIEALCAPGYHPMCDAIAVETVALVDAWLARAVRVPDDAVARSHLLHAAGMAAVAFQKGLGLCHAMAHPLGARTGLHHGLANAVLLPWVLAANRHGIAPACARLVARLELAHRADLAGASAAGPADPVDAVIAWVRRLAADCGLPPTAPVTVAAADLPALVAGARAEALYLATNPVQVTDDAIAAAYRGALGV
jgi:alcohol dehydrogenase class IV